jgi:hypothetical protein
MAAGDYESALPVALEAVAIGEKLFKPQPALQLFPLYLLAAQVCMLFGRHVCLGKQDSRHHIPAYVGSAGSATSMPPGVWASAQLTQPFLVRPSCRQTLG